MRNSPVCEEEHKDALTFLGEQIVSRWLGLFMTWKFGSHQLRTERSPPGNGRPTVIPPKCSSLISKTTTLTIPSVATVSSNWIMIDCWSCGENASWPNIPAHLWWPFAVASLKKQSQILDCGTVGIEFMCKEVYQLQYFRKAYSWDQ